MAESAAPAAPAAASADPLGGQAYLRAASLRGPPAGTEPHAKTLTAVGLKHAGGAGKASRTLALLERMMGMDKRPEASTLRIVTRAERERPFGSRAKMAGEAGAGGINGRPSHVQSSPVYRGILPPSVELGKRGKPVSLSQWAQGHQSGSRRPVRTGNGGAGTGSWRKRRPACNGWERGSSFAPPARELTSGWCDRTRPTRQTINQGSVYNG